MPKNIHHATIKKSRTAVNIACRKVKGEHYSVHPLYLKLINEKVCLYHEALVGQ